MLLRYSFGREGVIWRRNERRSDFERNLLMCAQRNRARSPSYLLPLTYAVTGPVNPATLSRRSG